MNLLLNLPADIETKLLEQAAHTGKSPETLVLEAIEEKLSPEDSPVMLPLDRWHAKFNEFLASLPRSKATSVDDSRESIYEGRGE